MAAQMGFKDRAACFNNFFFAHAFKTPSVPSVLLTLYDEGGCGFVKLVNMRPYPAMLGFFKDKRKGIIKFLMCAQPNEFTFSDINIRLELGFVFRANARVYAIAGNHQVIFFLIAFDTVEFGRELHLNAQLTGALLQQHQHPFAANTCKPVATRNGANTVMHNGDIIPVGKVIAD